MSQELALETLKKYMISLDKCPLHSGIVCLQGVLSKISQDNEKRDYWFNMYFEETGKIMPANFQIDSASIADQIKATEFFVWFLEEYNKGLFGEETNIV